MHILFKYITLVLLTFLLINCKGDLKNTTTNPQSTTNQPTTIPETKNPPATHITKAEYIDHPVMDKIRKLISASLSGEIKDVTFHTAGDSKRDNITALDKINYTQAFRKFHIKYSHQASSDITIESWVNNDTKYDTGLDTLKNSASTGDGQHNIIEFSLGTNDLSEYKSHHRNQYTNTYPTEEKQLTYLKKELSAGIDAIQKALPKALIFMAEATGIEDPVLKKALAIVAEEKKLPLIKGVLDYAKRQNMQSKFFKDSLHPSPFGSYKILQNTLRHITEGQARTLVKYDSPLYVNPPAEKKGMNLAEGVNILHQFRGTENEYSEGNEFRSITLPIQEGSVISIKQPGNYDTVYFLAEDGKGILENNTTDNGSKGAYVPIRDLSGNKTNEYFIHIPKRSKKIVINLNYDQYKGTAFDDKVEESPIEVRYMSQEDIEKKLPTQEEMEEGLLQ